MSKKKNTLKDLDEFLKQQAATLVDPPRLSDKIEAKKPEPVVEKREVEEEKETVESIAEPEIPKSEAPVKKQGVSAQQIMNDLNTLALQENDRFKTKFYDIIIKTIEARNEFTAEDKMLINTALYLKTGDRWKEAIRDYWRKHQP
jgi:hypothetical protein